MPPDEFIEQKIKENEDSVKNCLKADRNDFLNNLFQKLLQNETKIALRVCMLMKKQRLSLKDRQ